jgi:hypothetical protein
MFNHSFLATLRHYFASAPRSRPKRGRRKDVRVVATSLPRTRARDFAIVLALLAACSSDEESPREQCERVRNHIVNLRLDDLPSAESEQTREAHRASLTQALGDEFITNCEQQHKRRAIECALAALDVATATSCADL